MNAAGRRLRTAAAIISVTGSVALGLSATLFAGSYPQTTDFAGVDAAHLAQAQGLGCIYSRAVQLAGTGLIPGDPPPPLPGDLPWHFNEPPIITLLGSPFANVRIQTVVDVWEVALWLALAACAVLLWRVRAGLPHIVMAAVAAALLLNDIANTDLGLAQDDAILLVFAFVALELLRRRHDVTAGILLGIVAIKPQLVFLAFFVILIERRWQILAAGIATIAFVTAIGVAMVGPACSLKWLSSATQLGQFQSGIGIPDTIARLTGSAIGAEAVFVALAVAALVVLWKLRSRVDAHLLMTIALALAVVIGIHTLAYDVLLLAPLGIRVARSRPWSVVACGWAFTAAQLFDSIYLAGSASTSAPFQATEVVPLVAVILGIVHVVRSDGGSEAPPASRVIAEVPSILDSGFRQSATGA